MRGSANVNSPCRSRRERPASRRARAGFTLIELLLGLSIGTLIVAGAAAIFVTAQRSWEAGNRNYRLRQAARTTSELIERHLRSVTPPAGEATSFEGEDLSTDETSGHRLTFFSTAGGGLRQGRVRTDVSLIELRLDPAKDRALTLRMDSSPGIGYTLADQDEEHGPRVTLSPLIKSFEVLYCDGGEWVSEWSKSRLPKAVEFHLTLVDESGAGEPLSYKVSRMVTLPVEPTQDESAGSSTANSETSGTLGTSMNGKPDAQERK